VNVLLLQNELAKLENENETLSLDIEKMEKYLAGMDKWKSDAEANMLVIAGELQQKGVLDMSCIVCQGCQPSQFTRKFPEFNPPPTTIV